jgi:hypothetical protein
MPLQPLGHNGRGDDVAAISWNVLWVAAKNTIARAGAVLGRMLGAGSGLPVALHSPSRGKCRGGRR